MVKAWCWRGHNFVNFGDELGIEILKKLGYDVQFASLEEADIVTIGSVLDVVAEKAKDGCIVWGTGCNLGENMDISRLDVRAVRGELTKRQFGVDVPVGDPGLLASLFWDPSPIKQYRIGVVKHFLDTMTYPYADIVIDARLPVDEVIRLITSCEFIVSSSLHGFIIAKSYDIPVTRVLGTINDPISWKWTDFITGFEVPLPDVQDRLIKSLGIL